MLKWKRAKPGLFRAHVSIYPPILEEKFLLQKRGLPRPSNGGSKIHCNIKLQKQPINTFASHCDRQFTIVRNFNMLFIMYHWPITDLCRRLSCPRRGFFQHCWFQLHTGPLTKNHNCQFMVKLYINMNKMLYNIINILQNINKRVTQYLL